MKMENNRAREGWRPTTEAEEAATRQGDLHPASGSGEPNDQFIKQML